MLSAKISHGCCHVFCAPTNTSISCVFVFVASLTLGITGTAPQSSSHYINRHRLMSGPQIMCLRECRHHRRRLCEFSAKFTYTCEHSTAIMQSTCVFVTCAIILNYFLSVSLPIHFVLSDSKTLKGTNELKILCLNYFLFQSDKSPNEI